MHQPVPDDRQVAKLCNYVAKIYCYYNKGAMQMSVYNFFSLVLLSKNTRSRLTKRTGCKLNTRFAYLLMCRHALYHSTIVVIPWPGTKNSNTSLFGSINKAVSRVWVEPRNINVIVATQHCRDMFHNPALVYLVHRRHGVVRRVRWRIFRIVVLNMRFTYTISNQAKVGAGRELHACDGRSLRGFQGTG